MDNCLELFLVFLSLHPHTFVEPKSKRVSTHIFWYGSQHSNSQNSNGVFRDEEETKNELSQNVISFIALEHVCRVSSSALSLTETLKKNQTFMKPTRAKKKWDIKVIIFSGLWHGKNIKLKLETRKSFIFSTLSTPHFTRMRNWNNDNFGLCNRTQHTGSCNDLVQFTSSQYMLTDIRRKLCIVLLLFLCFFFRRFFYPNLLCSN